jgi:hypothetical protein
MFCHIKGSLADKDPAVVHIKERLFSANLRVLEAVRVFGLFPDNFGNLQRL